VVDAEAVTFLNGVEGKSLLAAWLKGYLAGAEVSDLDDSLKKNEERIQTKIDRFVEGYLKHHVAYSYNDTFLLYTQGGPTQHVLPFYKVDGDGGELNCEAIYPANPSKKSYPNKILYSYNDSTTVNGFGLLPTKRGSNVKKFDTIPEHNAALYDSTRPGHTLTAYQTINFSIEDDSPITEGPVTVQCTILIIGSARYDVGRK